MKKLTIITLDNAYLASGQSEAARHLYGEILRLRCEGYGPEYPPSFLPIDKADYVIWHHLYCYKENDKYIPVAGFRQVSMKRCDFYGIKIPLLESAETGGTPSHVQALEHIFSSNRTRNLDVVYSAGLTIRKPFRGDKEISVLIRELGAALTYRDMIERGVSEYVCAAVLRFKTNLWFETVGYKPLRWFNRELAPIQKRTAGDEPMLLMHLTQISDWSKQCFEKHADYFKNRINITCQNNNERKEAA